MFIINSSVQRCFLHGWICGHGAIYNSTDSPNLLVAARGGSRVFPNLDSGPGFKDLIGFEGTLAQATILLPPWRVDIKYQQRGR